MRETFQLTRAAQMGDGNRDNDSAESTADDSEPRSLDELLDRLDEAAEGAEDVSLGDVLDVVGRRSFGPMLLVAGLITLAPIIGDIPGMPTVMGLVVLLTAGQLLFQRDHFWLPQWLLKRSVKREKLLKGIKWMRRPAGFVDRMLRPRLTVLTRDGGVYAIAVVSIVVAAAMPAMEFVPFSANGAGLALTAFGLSLITRDGLVALVAFIFTAGTLGLVGYNLIWA